MARQLYPVEPIKNTAVPVNNKPITQSQYEELLTRVASIAEELQLSESEVDSLRQELSTAWTTGTINANNIDAVEAVLHSATINELIATTASIPTILSKVIRGELITGDRADVDEVNSITTTTDTLTAKNITTDSLKLNNTLSTDAIEAKDASADTAFINELTTNTTVANTARIEEALVGTAVVAKEEVQELTADEAAVDAATITNLKGDYSELEYITHSDFYQTIVDQDDYYIVLPKFTNGSYYLEARTEDNTKVFAIEVFNSDSNIQVRWSKTAPHWILDWDVITDDNIQFLQIHGRADSQAVKLYHQSQSLDNILPPDIYDTKQYEGKSFTVTEASGTYIPNPTFAGDMHVEELFIDKTIFDNLYINNNLFTVSARDQYGTPMSWCSGCVGDTLTVGEDGMLTWSKLADTIVEDGKLLTNQNTIYNYNGIAEDNNGDTAYPITELGDNTTVHGSEVVEKDLTATTSLTSPTINDSNLNCTVYNGLTNVANVPTGEYTCIGRIDTSGCFATVCCNPGFWWCRCIVDPSVQLYSRSRYDIEDPSVWYGPIVSYCYCSGALGDNYYLRDAAGNLLYHSTPATPILYTQGSVSKIGCWSRANSDGSLDQLAVYDSCSTLEHNKVVVYDNCRATLKTTNAASLDSLTVDTLTAEKIYAQELHAVQEEQEVATSDYLTLRANNDSALVGTSGVLINNYDGSNVAAIVTDNTGTIRTGNGSKTDTTYSDLYYVTWSGKWYSNSSLSIEVEPVGTLTAWKTVEELEWGMHYTDAVFSVVDLTDLQPLLTRSEESDMVDNALLKWDGSATCAATIAAPTDNEQELVYCAKGIAKCDYVIRVFGCNIDDGCQYQYTYLHPTSATTFECFAVPESWKQTRIVQCVRTDILVYAGLSCSGEYWYDISADGLTARQFTWNACTQCLTMPIKTVDSSLYGVIDNTFIIPANGFFTQVIEYTTGEYDGCYYWRDKQPGIYHFCNMAAYCSSTTNIPTGSIIVIDSECNYLYGDNQ